VVRHDRAMGLNMNVVFLDRMKLGQDDAQFRFTGQICNTGLGVPDLSTVNWQLQT
jgi:hypothetical protein